MSEQLLFIILILAEIGQTTAVTYSLTNNDSEEYQGNSYREQNILDYVNKKKEH